MEMTERTLSVLKNFATINSNIVFKKGKSLNTISVAKNILAKANVDVEFHQDFGIYDLNRFLALVSTTKGTPNLEFFDNYVLIKDSETGRSMKYHYSSMDMLTSPAKDVVMPEDCEVKFTLTSDDLSSLKRTAPILGYNEISITPEGDKVKLTVVDINDPTSDAFSTYATGTFEQGVNFNFVLNVNNLKIVNEDFDVSISSRLIANFQSLESPTEYFIALEKSSTYGEY